MRPAGNPTPGPLHTCRKRAIKLSPRANMYAVNARFFVCHFRQYEHTNEMQATGRMHVRDASARNRRNNCTEKRDFIVSMDTLKMSLKFTSVFRKKCPS